MKEQSTTTLSEKIIAVLVIGFILVVFGYFPLNAGNVGDDNDSPFSTSVDRDISISESFEAVEIGEDGFALIEVEEGTGESVESGDRVTIHFTGTLNDGSVFSSSRVNDQTFTFVLGDGTVVPGFDRGVTGMKIGGIRVLRIPPELAFGDVEIPGIPANSVIFFRVELLEVTR